MRARFPYFVLALALVAPISASESSVSADHFAAAKALAGEFEARLGQSRYMERGDVTDAKMQNWDGFPTKRYHYTMTDQDGTKKSADVVMLNASADHISRWIVSALVEVKGSYNGDDGRRVFKHIISQSGGQFPVSGVVYEDIFPADGKNEVYCFRDGVPVVVEGVMHRTADPLTPEEIKASISGKPTRVFTYARIASTTPEQFAAVRGSIEILKDGKPTLKWPEAIRKAYQEAWTSDRNPLIVAWVKGNTK